MTKENSRGGYELFYVELPRTETDPFSNISNDIQDVHEFPDEDFHGLSDEQVSEIARDSLQDAQEQPDYLVDYRQLQLNPDAVEQTDD